MHIYIYIYIYADAHTCMHVRYRQGHIDADVFGNGGLTWFGLVLQTIPDESCTCICVYICIHPASWTCLDVQNMIKIL